MEKFGDFGAFRGLELHRCIICLAMDGNLPRVQLSSSFDTRYIFELYLQCHLFEVNHLHISEVMSDLLKSGMFASREETVKEMKECRSTTDS